MESKQEITDKITGIIATTIGVKPAEVNVRDSLVNKYSLESLDILDISFRVNKEFAVKLFRGDFLQKAAAALGASLVEDGKLTEAAVKMLKDRLPEAVDNPALVVGAPKTILAKLYCVDSWVRQILELREANQPNGEAFLDDWLAKYKQTL